MYKIDISRAAGQIIKALPPKQYRQIVATILSLRENPAPSDSKQLSGDAGYHHVDIGEHRIIYRFDKDKVNIAVIGNRNDDEVFKRFAQ
ncbi:MAG: type II toxin-antitoxin system RelE/ParE family toxin [Desulfatiglans sp.]|nr:type II toxin-antitoxin system RelE/ParE family toxin [Desulfatiglans sp.]